MSNRNEHRQTERMRQTPAYTSTKRIGASGGQKAIAALLSILLFITVLAAVLVGNLRWLTRQSTVQSIIMEQTASQRESDQPANADSAAVSDALYRSVPEELLQELNLDRENFNEYMERSTWLDYLAGSAGGIVQDVIDGTTTTRIQEADLQRILNENDSIYEDITGQSMDPEIRNVLAESLAGSDLGGLSADAFTQDETGQALAWVRPFVSKPLLIGLAIASVVLAVIIIAVMRGRYRLYSPNLAIPLILVGIVLVAFRFLVDLFNQLVLPSGPSTDLIVPFSNALGQRFLIFGLIALAVGIVMLVIRAFVPAQKGFAQHVDETGRRNPYMD